MENEFNQIISQASDETQQKLFDQILIFLDLQCTYEQVPIPFLYFHP